MNLGEKIYQLRIEKNLSQGDLAEKLEVSRQSVSKWENNTAVPDLDKLIKLCDVFEISLDELTGREIIEKEANTIIQQGSSLTVTKIMGCILLGITIIGALLFILIDPYALYLCIPLLLCAIICFKVKKYAWYWCIWAVYLSLITFLNSNLLSNILYIIEFSFMIIMPLVTYKFVDFKIKMRKETKLLLLSIIIIFAIFYASLICFKNFLDLRVSHTAFAGWVFPFTRTVLTGLLNAGAIYIACFIREVRQKKKNN